MLIGELAERAGVNPKTIRFYEEVGVIPPPERTSSGYRRYGTEAVDRLALVRRARQLDLRLEEIAEILALRDRGQAPCDLLRELAEQRLAAVEDRIVELHRIRDELRDVLDSDPAEPNPTGCCQLLER